jgi:leucyl aminopeptidase
MNDWHQKSSNIDCAAVYQEFVMEHFVATASPARQRTDCAIVGVYEKGVLSDAAAELDTKLSGKLSRLVKNGDVRGKLSETLLIGDLKNSPCQRVLLVGLGAREAFARKPYRKALTAATALLVKSGAREAINYLALEKTRGVDAYDSGRITAEVAANALYRIPDLKTAKKPPTPALKRFGVAAERSNKSAVERGLVHGRGISLGMAFMRDLANLPANVCTPSYIANSARGLARDYRSIRVKVLGEPEMRKLKMGTLLSVTRGSDEPARLVVAEYRGGGAEPPVALVGKGVTFDTGGISLKPPPAMDEMKFDMSGAASVLGALKAAAELKLPINLVVVVPACENMPSGRATKPGDIVKTMSGLTVEILNTDAEGRLILCDALTYVRRFKPSVVIDVATLTGACVVALGNHFSGLFGNNDELADELFDAGQRADDRAWRMPIADEYTEQLKSNFADIANVAGREGGAITAACYLSKFTKDLNWAHLDIAGTAYLSGSQKSSTGRPVPLLVEYLLSKK